jgi:hypothetical protein
MNCKYYCKDEGMCMLYSSRQETIYCQNTPCGDYKEAESKPTYEELYEYWLKTKDKPKKKRRKKVEVEQLPGQLDMFDIIDKKGEE